MIRANQIVYNVTDRSVFDIKDEPRFQPAAPSSGLLNKLPSIGKRPEGVPIMNNMNGVLLAGTPRCYENPVLGLNRILRPEPVNDGFGLVPMNPVAGLNRAAPMPPVFIQ